MTPISILWIASFVIVIWFTWRILWGILSNVLKAKKLTEIDEKVKVQLQGLQNLAGQSEDNFSRIVIQKVDLQNLWAKVKVRILSSHETAGKLTGNFILLLLEIQNITRREVAFESIVNLGGWDESFHKEVNDAQSVSLAAIDQVLLDIKKDLS